MNKTTKSFRILNKGVEILDKYGPDSDNFTEFRIQNSEDKRLLELIDSLAWFKKKVNEDPNFLRNYPKRWEIMLGFLFMAIFLGIFTYLVLWGCKCP
jgi:hypothetical protein